MPQWVERLANEAIRRAPLPVARALNQIPGGPTLVLGAANTLYNIAKTYGQVSADFDPLYKHLDQIFSGTADAKSVGTLQALSGNKRTANGEIKGAVPPQSNAEGSGAIQSPFDPRNARGSAVDVDMVRGMGYRRLRRPRNPGTAYRRIFRSWTGLSRIRGRYRRRWNKPELKSIDGFVGTAPLVLFQNVNTHAFPGVSNGNMVLLNRCSQGTKYNERIGNQILIKYMLIRACISCPDNNQGTVSYQDCVRIMVIKDRQANGSVPAVGDLFETPNSTGGTVVTYATNLANRFRFKVLCDRHYVLSGASNAAEFFFEYNSKRKHRVEYNGTATPATEAEIRTNSIWLCCFGPYASGGTIANTPYLDALTFRTRFVDP